MTTDLDIPKKRDSSLIRPRPRAGPVIGLILSLLFAVVVTPIIMADRLLEPTFERSAEAPVTVRVPVFGAQPCMERTAAGRGSIVVARGQLLDADTTELARCAHDAQPDGPPAFLAYLMAMFLVALLYTSHLRSTHGGRLVRTQVMLLLTVVLAAVAVKAGLMVTPISLLIVPVAGFAILAAVVVDLGAGLATGLLAAVVFSCLAPFDAGVLSILSVQAIATVMVLGGGARKKREIIVASAFGGLSAAIAYLVFYYLSWRGIPAGELDHPLHSAWVAAALAGPLSALLALVGETPLHLALGSVTRHKLVELEDLGNPLLKQIASKAPGSWQHSLAMANMAEIAANAIGASGRLVRVGAYYHDLGKSLTPKYFIENLAAGEPSPHDALAPEDSCAAIFNHVTEGVRLGRKRGLPERIIDFMHMHHGDGLLEYFWAKCQESGNPQGLTEDDFRYPGVRPHSRETAILAIVDAVEAASRTLKQPEEGAIKNLVQRIVYGKLHLGQLDDSGLTAADLRKISNSLIETIKHAHHGRIEYPWQKKEAEEKAAARRAADGDEAAADVASPEPKSAAGNSRRKRTKSRSEITHRFAREPRLDSLDVPRPLSRKRADSPAADRAKRASTMEVAATERLSTTAETRQLGPEDQPLSPEASEAIASAVDQAIDDEETAAEAADRAR